MPSRQFGDWRLDQAPIHLNAWRVQLRVTLTPMMGEVRREQSRLLVNPSRRVNIW